MRPAPLQPLAALLGACAVQTVHLQQQLDQQWFAAVETCKALGALSAWRESPITRRLFESVAPSRLVADQVEFTVSARLEQSSTTGFEIKAVPLNLGCAVTHRVSLANAARLRLQVETVPFPSPPRER